jgi:tRNA (cytidine56-2'-O)-methyltransferase
MQVHVLRLGHRAARDKRVTTHLALVSRAFGAEKILISGIKDKGLGTSIQRVTDSWGGRFSLEFVLGWNQVIEDYKNKNFAVVHLTMYGLPIQEKMSEIRTSEKILVVVGGEKVPSEVYQMVDYNLAITNQPHSEISALAVFLDRLFEGEELGKNFQNAKQRIVPQVRSKQVLKLE